MDANGAEKIMGLISDDFFYPIFCKNLQDAHDALELLSLQHSHEPKWSVPRILIASSGRACRSAIWTLGEPRGFFLG